MILIVLAALCLVTVPLTGGRLHRLADLRVRWLWLGPLAVFLQTVVVTIAPGGSHSLHALIHIGSYVLIGAFLWVNRRTPGAPIIALGACLNGLVIVINNGVMPASATALRLAGLTLGKGFHNSIVLAHPHLPWLGDTIPVPWPLRNVLSVGDCIIYIGMLVLLHRTCRRPAVAESTAVSTKPATDLPHALEQPDSSSPLVAPVLAPRKRSQQPRRPRTGANPIWDRATGVHLVAALGVAVAGAFLAMQASRWSPKS